MTKLDAEGVEIPKLYVGELVWQEAKKHFNFTDDDMTDNGFVLIPYLSHIGGTNGK